MRLALVCVALVAAGALAVQARADGDPASDYLITQPVYFPYDGKFSPQLEGQLLAVVNEAKKRGFPIKVALIPNSYDLGSVTSLWRKPRLYARFLGEEDATFFKQRLLVVMPNGFGFYRPGHSVTARVRGARDDPDPAGRQRSRACGARRRPEARRRGRDRRHGAVARDDARATELARPARDHRRGCGVCSSSAGCCGSCCAAARVRARVDGYDEAASCRSVCVTSTARNGQR